MWIVYLDESWTTGSTGPQFVDKWSCARYRPVDIVWSSRRGHGTETGGAGQPATKVNGPDGSFGRFFYWRLILSPRLVVSYGLSPVGRTTSCGDFKRKRRSFDAVEYSTPRQDAMERLIGLPAGR
jgi:hypothetical protein